MTSRTPTSRTPTSRTPAFDPSDVHAVHGQIERLLEVKKLDHAARMLAEAFASAPDHVDNHYYAARIAYDRKRYAEAASELERVLGERPQHTLARLLFVSVSIEQKRYAEAEQLLVGLIREHPESGPLYAKYAWLMLLTLNVDKARALTEEALRLSPEDSLPQSLDLLVALIDGRRERAGDRLRELIANDPESHHVAGMLVMVLADERRYQEALPIAQEILRADPNDPDALETVIRLKAASHWVARANWPNERFGWGGAIATWALAVVGMQVLGRYDPTAALVFAASWLCYVIYSWVHQPLLRRWLRARGF